MMEIQKIFNEFQEMSIEDLIYQMAEKKIEMVIKTTGIIQKEWTVVFEDVAEFCWINKRYGAESNIAKWGFIDLTLPVVKIDNAQFSSMTGEPNISLEMWDTMFLIEAGRVRVSDEVYRLKPRYVNY